MMQKGSCTKNGCSFSHEIITCEHCNVVCTDEASWKGHINGKKHKSTLAARGQVYKGEFYCSDCNRNFDNQRALNFHLGSPGHRKIIRVIKYKQQKEQSQSDKAGFSVSDTSLFDLGVLTQLNQRISLSFIVENRNYSAGTLVSLNFQNKDSYCIEIMGPVPGYPLNLAAYSEKTIRLEFRAKRWGYFQTELEFVFQMSGQQVVITRMVKAFIGDRAMFESLLPKTEYKKKEIQRVTIVNDDDDFIPAGKIPELDSSLASRYVKDLKRYDVPDKVGNVLNGPASSREMSARDLFVKNFLPKDYSQPESYQKHYSHLLWAEEAQLEIDIKKYSLFGIQVESASRGRSYIIKVPGLAEGRPSVLLGDSVLVKQSDKPKSKAFEGKAVDIHLEEVVLKFASSFAADYMPGLKYDVQFKYNRLPWRRMQLAVSTSTKLLTGFDSLYRSDEARQKSLDVDYMLQIADSYKWDPYDRLLKGNPEQLRAISIILNDLFTPFPFLIHGPPGTGKTVTIVEAIKQLFFKNRESRILVCAPSNSAADLLLERLSKNLTVSDIFRLNAISRSVPMKKELQKFTMYRKDSDAKYDVPDMKKLLSFRILVTTCCSAAVLSGLGVPGGHFTHVFIDEAGQALEPEAQIALNTFNHPPTTRMILAGDHKQLGPIIHSNVSRNLGLGISLLERLMNYCTWEKTSYPNAKLHTPRARFNDSQVYGPGTQLYSIKLLKNYRSHESILKVPNELFYNSELKVCVDPFISEVFKDLSFLPNPSIPVMFMHTLGKDMREAESPSWFNITEIQQVVQIIASLKEEYGTRLPNNQIGVITPYNQQVRKIQTQLRARFEGVSVGTVENFQGQERRVIIISTVRSNPEYMEHDANFNLGFLNDPKRFNVAMTRSQALQIVIGNGNILCQDPCWHEWIQFCIDNKCVSGMDSELLENMKKHKLKDLGQNVYDSDDEAGAIEAGWRDME